MTPSAPTDYVLSANVLAADSPEDFGTLADAATHKDTDGILTLESEGKAFMLTPGTRVNAMPLYGTEGEVCGGTSESGDHIGQEIVLACKQLQ